MSDLSFEQRYARPFPLEYRQEIVPRIMEAIAKGDSCYIVGVSGAGKSNLFRFLKSAEAQQKYLGYQPRRYAFVWADTNALAGELSAFQLYELILYNLQKWLEANQTETLSPSFIANLHEKIILSENRVLAQRHLETALRYLFRQIDDLHLVVLFDEFEPIAEQLDFQFFKSLRWLRDEFKYHLSYVMAAHRSPVAVREKLFDQGEPFYELLAANILALGLYNRDDTEFMIAELSRRFGLELSEAKKEIVWRLGGGHGGLTGAICRVLFKHSLPHDETWQVEQLLAYDSVAGECRKIWNSLEGPEQDALIQLINSNFAPGEPLPLNGLIAKGLIYKEPSGQIDLFSPLFREFLIDLIQPKRGPGQPNSSRIE